MHTALLLLVTRPDDLARVWGSASPPIEPGAETAMLLFDRVTVTAELSGRTTDPGLVAAASGQSAVVVMRAMSHTATVTVKGDTAAALERALDSIGQVGAGLIWRPENGTLEVIGQHLTPTAPDAVRRSAVSMCDPKLAGEAIYVLLSEEPSSLGVVLADHMPNRAAELNRSGAMSTVVRFDDEDARVTLQVIAAIDMDRLAAHAGGELPAHAAAVQITAMGTASTLDQVMYQVSFAAELARRPEAAGVWIPWQERFEPAGVILGEDPEKLPHIAVHSGRTDDMDVLYTRGMRRFRGRELISQDPGPDYPITALLLLVCANAIDTGQLPQPDGRTDSGLPGFDALFHDITDPWSDEPALNIELVEQDASS